MGVMENKKRVRFFPLEDSATQVGDSQITAFSTRCRQDRRARFVFRRVIFVRIRFFLFQRIKLVGAVASESVGMSGSECQLVSS